MHQLLANYHNFDDMSSVFFHFINYTRASWNISLGEKSWALKAFCNRFLASNLIVACPRFIFYKSAEGCPKIVPIWNFVFHCKILKSYYRIRISYQHEFILIEKPSDLCFKITYKTFATHCKSIMFAFLSPLFFFFSLCLIVVAFSLFPITDF